MEGHQSTIHRLGLVILAFVILSFAPVRVFAMEGYGVSVFPATTKEYPVLRSWFVYEADPGTEIRDKVLIKNHSNSTVALKVAVLDGAVTKDGGYTLVRDVEANKDVGTWATLSRTSVTLPPKTQQTIDLTVKVPANADVGSHPGGVVIWEDTTATADTKKSAGQLTVVTRVAARLYLTVPGDIIRALRVENVTHTIYKGVLYFQMTMHNDGNVQLTPKADVKLRGIFGSAGEQKKSQFGMILRGGQINARIPWQKKPPKFGRFVVDFRIHYGEEDFQGNYIKDEYQDVRYVFWLIPWMTILWWLIGLALLLLVRKFWLWIMIRQRLNTKTLEHRVKKGETLTMIASIYEVNPKKIAKFNLLKWPYDLMAGDILLIPQGQLTKEERRGKSVTPPNLPLYKGRRGGVSFPIMTKGLVGMTESGLEPVIAEAGDSVKTVAEFVGVSERDIIALNHLKWPYRLSAGQELLVPLLPGPVNIKIKSSKGPSSPRPPRRSKPRRRKPS